MGIWGRYWLLRKIFFSLFVLACFGLAGSFAYFIFVERQAQGVAEKLIGDVKSNADYSNFSDQEKIIALGQAVFNNFEKNSDITHPLLRLRPYLTSQYLPDFISLSEGAVELNVRQGLCDNAARMLSFLLKKEGFDSRQWDMVTDDLAHTALVVRTSHDSEVFIDPFFGVYPEVDGEMVSIKKAQQLHQSGRRSDVAFKDLGAKAESGFYNQLAHMRMAGEKETLIIKSKIPLTNGAKIELGVLDGSVKDVIRAGSEAQITPYWHYIGSRYNRHWVRVLEAQEDIRLSFDIIGDVDTGALTSSPAARIEGNRLLWIVKKGQKITFVDGKAKRSWIRLNSYQDVDRIVIEPIQIN